MTPLLQSCHRSVAISIRQLLLLVLISTALLAQGSADEALLNQIQVLGSHNSYKEAIDPSLLKLLRKNNPDSYKGLEYAHVSLTRQLDLGLRKFELDVLHDPEGGRYARPYGLEMLRQANLPLGAPYDPQGLMQKPGLKVLHVQDMDFRSNVYTFKQALVELRAWSNAHPRHLPIVITMNAKDSSGEDPNFTPALPFDKEAFDAWDAEIREILSDEKLLLPDDVRSAYLTLEAAVLDHAWPPLGESRGRFLFVLDETGEKLDTYVQGHSSLRGRVMFVNAREGRPEAAFRIVNNPIEDFSVHPGSGSCRLSCAHTGGRQHAGSPGRRISSNAGRVRFGCSVHQHGLLFTESGVPGRVTRCGFPEAAPAAGTLCYYHQTTLRLGWSEHDQHRLA